MAKIRVFAIDDSTLARRELREALLPAQDLELIGVVSSSGIALQRLGALDPEVILLDLSLAEEHWDVALRRLRSAHPRSRVIALAPATREGHSALLQAISCGATDGLARPENEAERLAAGGELAPRLLKAIRAAAALPATNFERRELATEPPRAAAPIPRRQAAPARVDCVVVAVSTGGPNALAQLLPALPVDFAAPIVIVQHMPAGFTGQLAGNLALQCRIRVREAEAGEELRPALALLAPGDRHLVIQRRLPGWAVGLHRGPPQNFCRPSADVLFRSAAEVFGAGALAVVLTGMGHDGLLGAQAISDAGGRVIVQDQPSSVVWGMPGAVAQAGLADAVLPLPEIVEELVRRVQVAREPRVRRG